MQFERIESRYLAYIVVTKLCYVKIKWQSKRVLSTCDIVYICINILYQYYINMYIFYIIVYRGTTFNFYNLLNMNYSQNTSLSMTYYPEPFHNAYKSDVRLLYGLLLKVHFGYDIYIYIL